jgi:phosphoadenosine phosphosulfate reductase
MDKVQHSIELIRKAEKLALTYNDFGFHLAFSGGKDSQVIYELAKMAGVKFKAYFYKTSVDPRELLSFIRSNYPDVEWVRPKMTMYQLIFKKGMLPLRQARFCCEYLKERNGVDAVVITGITADESAK